MEQNFPFHANDFSKNKKGRDRNENSVAFQWEKRNQFNSTVFILMTLNLNLFYLDRKINFFRGG